jgi:hypothetical protein
MAALLFPKKGNDNENVRPSGNDKKLDWHG